LNFSDEAVQVQLPGEWSGGLVLSTRMDHSGEIDLHHLTLRAYEGLLIELN
jgi:hypothetical protein